jgi:hypothetical protein
MSRTTTNTELDNLIEEITVDRNDEEEVPMGFDGAFDEDGSFPCPGTVVGEPLEVLSVSAGDERRGLTATCQRAGRRYEIALLDIDINADPATARLIAAYRRWTTPRAMRPDWTPQTSPASSETRSTRSNRPRPRPTPPSPHQRRGVPPTSSQSRTSAPRRTFRTYSRYSRATIRRHRESRERLPHELRPRRPEQLQRGLGVRSRIGRPSGCLSPPVRRACRALQGSRHHA